MASRGARDFDLGAGVAISIRASKASRAAARNPAGSTQGKPGAFSSNAGEISAVNALFATEIQAIVFQNIQKAMKPARRKASTNRLLRVTAAPGNIGFNPERFGVGRPKFLNNSEAKYWRTQEEGSEKVWKHPFIGTQLTPFIAPGAKRTVPFPVPHDATPQGLRTGALPKWLAGSGLWVVQHEIEPMHAYRDAYKTYRPGDRANRALRGFIDRNGRLRALAWDGTVNMTR